MITAWIRHSLLLCLIFSLFISCNTASDTGKPVSIFWKDSLASGLVINRRFLNSASEDSLPFQLTAHVSNEHTHTAILGDFDVREDDVIFRPLIPLTPGLKYEVHHLENIVGAVEIPLPPPGESPAVIAIHPTSDTVPHNLLKIYIRFSRPMREGEALQHVTLIKNGRDTIKNALLDLQPELWNRNRTTLTLWLDPGRIKRDLQPNKALGEPLEEGAHYQLTIQPDWKGANGALLRQAFQKTFFVSSRDEKSPSLDAWTIRPDNDNAKLIIDLQEPLDYMLLNSSLEILGKNNQHIDGKIETAMEERLVYFMPFTALKPGTYYLKVESRLEDLAGNNLNRLFDRDISTHSPDKEKSSYTKQFIIK